MPFDLDPSFRTHRVREGYDLDHVDDFVDRVLDTLDGSAGTSALTPEAIESYEFRVVRFRECYSMDDVDDWLDAAAAALRQGSRPAASQQPAHVQAPVPARIPAQESPRTGVPAAATPMVPVAAGVAVADPEATQAWPAAVAPAGRPPAAQHRPDPGVPAPRHQARTVASVPAPSNGLHHLEVWVEDLAGSVRSLGWLFERLGWTLFQVWENGRAWQAPGRGPYVVVETSPAMTRQAYDRRRPGLNHLALAVPERWMVDRVVEEAPGYGWRLLFSDTHPYAGGPGHYAAYLENAEGFEVEVVAS